MTLHCDSSSSCFLQVADTLAFFFFLVSFQAISSISACLLASSASASLPCFLASAYATLRASLASMSLWAFSASTSLHTRSASAVFRTSSCCCLCRSSFARFALSSATLCSQIWASSPSNETLRGRLADIFGGGAGLVCYIKRRRKVEGLGDYSLPQPFMALLRMPPLTVTCMALWAQPLMEGYC